jgi:hypothetical protein
MNRLVAASGVVFIALMAACAASETSSSSSSSGSGATATTAQGGGGSSASGGSSTTTGTGGNTGPCGTDCSLINTPQCQVAQCNTQTGQCEVVNDEEGVACDDGVFCTISDTCSAGACVGGPPNDCGMAPPQCTEVTCDEMSQTCATAPSMNGAPCQDPNDLCLKGSTCTSGQCVGGSAEDCFFFPVPSDCHVAVCSSTNGMCEAQIGNLGGLCNDPNDLCTVNKTCDNLGMCVAGDPKDCSQLTQGCVLGVCDVNTGQCVAQNLMNNDACDDLNPCTTGETCQNGGCSNGTPVTACTNGDNCCPMGCTVNNDVDCATTDMDVGLHGSIYTANQTRGYWFTAPTAFTIKEVRVPLEVGTADQHVQIVRFNNNTPPPQYSLSTTAFQTIFYATNVAGTGWIPVNVVVNSGEVIGVLGARGTSTSLNNSYAAMSPYQTSIFSQPVTLARLLFQGNIAAGQAGPLSGAGGTYARVELRYGP